MDWVQEQVIKLYPKSQVTGERVEASGPGIIGHGKILPPRAYLGS